MLGQVVEIIEPNRYLSLEYGSLLVKSDGVVLGRLDLDHLQSLIINPQGVTVSASLLTELAARGIPVVFSGKKFLPVGILLPVSNNFESASRIELQAQASEPMKKQAWKKVVQSKILLQALSLKVLRRNYADILDLTTTVKSGDPQNIEAQSARLYWPRLFGAEFRRDRDLEGENALLNYGYTVLRSTVARALSAAGLHPGLGIHHRSQTNTMRLADDFMEPFRPLVDLRVFALVNALGSEINRDTKSSLITLMSMDFPTAAGVSPLAVAISRTAQSYVRYLRKDQEDLELPNKSYEPYLLEILDYEL